MKSTKTGPFFIALSCTRSRTSLVRSPSKPFFKRSKAYGVCSGEEGRYYHNGVCLEIWVEFLSCYSEG